MSSVLCFMPHIFAGFGFEPDELFIREEKYIPIRSAILTYPPWI